MCPEPGPAWLGHAGISSFFSRKSDIHGGMHVKFLLTVHPWAPQSGAVIRGSKVLGSPT